MTKYAQEIEDAYNDLKDAGVEMLLAVETQGTYDPAECITGPSTTVEYPTYGIWKKKNIQSAGDSYLNGTLIASGDKFALIAAKGLTVRPVAGDRLKVSGVEYEILNSKALDPDDEPILFDLHVRR